MPNAGIMASAVVTGVCTDVLSEPFDNLTHWAISGFSIVSGGRTGNMAQSASGGNEIDYVIPSVSESNTVTLGFAFQTTSLAATRNMVQWRSDAGGTNQVAIYVLTDGSIQVRRGTAASGTILGTTATGIITVNTWYYIESQVVLSDTAGVVTIRVGGATVLNLTAQDTNNSGTKTTFDTLALLNTSGGVHSYDDLYLSTGSGCTFKGAQSIVNTGPVILTDPFNNLTAWAGILNATSAAGGRTGNAASITANGTMNTTVPSSAQSARLVADFWINPTAASADRVIAQFQQSSTIVATLGLYADGHLEAFAGNLAASAGATAAGAVVNGTWYHVVFNVTKGPTGTANVTASLNGVQFANGAGLNQTTTPFMDTFYLRNAPSGGQGALLFDDLTLSQ